GYFALAPERSAVVLSGEETKTHRHAGDQGHVEAPVVDQASRPRDEDRGQVDVGAQVQLVGGDEVVAAHRDAVEVIHTVTVDVLRFLVEADVEVVVQHVLAEGGAGRVGVNQRTVDVHAVIGFE